MFISIPSCSHLTDDGRHDNHQKHDCYTAGRLQGISYSESPEKYNNDLISFLLFKPFPASHNFFHLIMFLGSLYCKPVNLKIV